MRIILSMFATTAALKSAEQSAGIREFPRGAESRASALKQGIEDESSVLAARERDLVEGIHDVALRVEEETRKARTLSVTQQRDEVAKKAEKEKMNKLETSISLENIFRQVSRAFEEAAFALRKLVKDTIHTSDTKDIIRKREAGHRVWLKLLSSCLAEPEFDGVGSAAIFTSSTVSGVNTDAVEGSDDLIGKVKSGSGSVCHVANQRTNPELLSFSTSITRDVLSWTPLGH